MGRPKWREPVGGIPMALRAAEALTPHVREVVLLAPDQDSGALGLPVVADAARGVGPLAGLVAALECAVASGDRGVLALACDLPLVDSGLLGALVSAWAGEDLVAPEHAGRVQPLLRSLVGVGATAGPGRSRVRRPFSAESVMVSR